MTATTNGTASRRPATPKPKAPADSPSDGRFSKLARVKAEQDRKIAAAAERRRLFVECGANAGLIDLLERVEELRLRATIFAERYSPKHLRNLYKKHGIELGDCTEPFNPTCLVDGKLCAEMELTNHLSIFIGDYGFRVAHGQQSSAPSEIHRAD